MEHEIKIYGEIVHFQGKHIEDRGYTNLNIVDDQLKKAGGKDVLVRLHTVGGDVDEGFAIYASLRRYAKDNNAKITTRADGQVASIGTVIFLAGDERIGSPYIQPFFHKAQSSIEGDDEQIKIALAGNEEANKRISLHYSQHTNLTEEDAMELMSVNTFLPPEDAEGLRFSTSTEEIQRPKALLNRKIQNNMSDKNKQSAWNKLMKDAEALFKSTKNKLVFTADNSELDFYELSEDDTPVIGNKAKFDGKPAGDSNNGEYVMPSGETYKFDGEELIEIVAKTEAQSDDLQTENQKLTEEVQNLKTEIQNLKNSSKEKDNKITGLNNQLSQSKTIITNFKNLGNAFEDEEDEGKREPKPKPEEKGKSRVSNALSKFKKEK